MSIPISTTTITVRRPTVAEQSGDPWGDGYEDAPGVPSAVDGQGTVVTTSVRAIISAGSARGSSNGSESQSAEFSLVCDPTDLTHLDTVTDESTGETYSVAWSLTTRGVAGLGHTSAGLNMEKGQAS